MISLVVSRKAYEEFERAMRAAGATADHFISHDHIYIGEQVLVKTEVSEPGYTARQLQREAEFTGIEPHKPDTFEMLSIAIETIRRAQCEKEADECTVTQLRNDLKRFAEENDSFRAENKKLREAFALPGRFLRSVQSYVDGTICSATNDVEFMSDICVSAAAVLHQMQYRPSSLGVSQQLTTLLRMAATCMRWHERIKVTNQRDGIVTDEEIHAEERSG